MKAAPLGSISSGTHRYIDLMNIYATALSDLIEPGDDDYRKHLKLIGGAETLAEFLEPCDAPDTSAMQNAYVADVIAELTEALGQAAPDYCYFGAHPGDGADFGFWLLEDWQQLARDDGTIFMDAGAELPADLPPGTAVCFVNDHGNISFGHVGQQRTFNEVWSVV